MPTYSRRLRGLDLGARYRVTTNGAVTNLRLSRAANAPSGNWSLDPNYPNTPHSWGDVNGTRDFWGEHEIMYLVADSALTAVTVERISAAWPAPQLTPDSGVDAFRYKNYPATPGSPTTTITTDNALNAALNAASDGDVILVNDGVAAGNVSLTGKRWPSGVTVQAASRFGATIGNVEMTDVEGLTFCGFRTSGTVIKPRLTRGVTLRHLLLHGGATIQKDGGQEPIPNFGLTIEDVDVIGGPASGTGTGLLANLVGNGIDLRAAHGLRLIGVRVLWVRADSLRVNGYGFEKHRSMLAESYTAQGVIDGISRDDHGDLLQGFFGFEGGGAFFNRANRDWTIRDSVLIDDYYGTTGSQLSTRGQGLNVGNQANGALRWHVENSIFATDALNNQTYSVRPAVRDHTVKNCTIIALNGTTSAGVLAQGRQLGVWAGRFEECVISGSDVLFSDNPYRAGYEPASVLWLNGETLSALYDDPAHIGGLTAKTGGKLASGGSHEGYGALALAAAIGPSSATPATMEPGRWGVSSPGAGQIRIDVYGPPDSWPYGLTWDYSTNGGSTWNTSTILLPAIFSQTISPGAGTYQVQIRARRGSAIGAGSASKEITV